MQLRVRRWSGLAIAAASLCPVWAAGSGQIPESSKADVSSDDGRRSERSRPNGQRMRELSKRLEGKAEEISALEARSADVTKRLGELASSGKLPTSDEAIALMRQMVEEMAQIRASVQRVEAEIGELKASIGGQEQSIPALTRAADKLNRVGWANFVQFQYTDTQEGSNSPGGANRTNSDGFVLRRYRIATTNRIDPKTSLKLSFDVAAGSQRLAAEAKDAILVYDIEPFGKGAGKQVLVGQQKMGIGYEMDRSAPDRDFPEAAQYNRTMFGGERNRGVRYKHGIGGGAWVEAGVWNALTVGDPQQTDANTFRNLLGTQVAATGAIRVAAGPYEAGLSAFVGERPGTSERTVTTWRDLNGNGQPDPGEVSTVNVPATQKADRRFLYADAQYVGLFLPQITARAEFMVGRDRVPTLGSNGVPVSLAETDVRGWHIILNYSVDSRNIVSLKYETFDTGIGSNDVTSIYGVAYTHYINPGAKILLSHEWPKEQGFDRKNNLTTIRLQYKM